MKHPLSVISTDNKQSATTQKTSRRQEVQARFERVWLRNPNSFNPLRHATGKERVKRTFTLIDQHLPSKGDYAADLGCGSSIFSRYLREKGYQVHAVDIASNALKPLKEMEGITTFCDYVPNTTLKDNAYSLILALDIIAELHPKEQRLFFAEIARLLTKEGTVICSTPLDINSEDPLELFAQLATTEFHIDKWVFSYHRLFIRLLNLFKIPRTYVKAFQDKHFFKEELNKRGPLSQKWLQLQASFLLFPIWWSLALVTNPLLKLMKNSSKLMHILEKITRFFYDKAGISHAIFVGKKRPIVDVSSMPHPQESKHKKQLWE